MWLPWKQISHLGTWIFKLENLITSIHTYINATLYSFTTPYRLTNIKKLLAGILHNTFSSLFNDNIHFNLSTFNRCFKLKYFWYNNIKDAIYSTNAKKFAG